MKLMNPNYLHNDCLKCVRQDECFADTNTQRTQVEDVSEPGNEVQSVRRQVVHGLSQHTRGGGMQREAPVRSKSMRPTAHPQAAASLTRSWQSLRREGVSDEIS